MPVEVIMPKVDMDMTAGKVLAWHVEEGSKIAKGDLLFEIETDKAAMEVEAEADGYLHHCVAEDTTVQIGQPVAWIYADGEDVGQAPASDQPGQAAPVAGKSLPQSVAAAPADPSPTQTDKVRATPRARRLARAAGLDLQDIEGSGPRQRVQSADVTALLERPAQAHPQSTGLRVTTTPRGTGTPIVMIHGFAGDARSWALLEAHLTDRPVIRIELPCHGGSPQFAVRGFADLAAHLRHAVDDLHLETFELVGHSLGGALALALADTRPRRVAALTLIAPAGLGPEVNGPALDGICTARRAESLGPWLKTLVADETLVTDRYVREVMSSRDDPQLRKAQQALAEVLFPDGVQAFDLRAALARVEAPTRVIWGTRDNIIPWRHALRAPGRVALHLFDGIGHLPQIECPAEVGKLIMGRL